jgi:hypothetical protein
MERLARLIRRLIVLRHWRVNELLVKVQAIDSDVR